MRHAQEAMSQILPVAAPADHAPRLLLYAIRRMGAHGLKDAHAVNALLGTFGRSHRRPLILLRAFLAETARASKLRIKIAACCCARMTHDEAMLIDIVSVADADPRAAHRLLATCLGTGDCIGAVTSAQALGQAFADLGQPLA
jgi:hypothetical protein